MISSICSTNSLGPSRHHVSRQDRAQRTNVHGGVSSAVTPHLNPVLIEHITDNEAVCVKLMVDAVTYMIV